jgi:hypothetical protein
MTWEVGTPTDKSGPAYRKSRKRQFLKYAGAVGLGFGGGALFTRQESDEGIVSAFGNNSTANGSDSGAPTGTPTATAGGDPTIEGIGSIDAHSNPTHHALVSVTVSNPTTTAVRRGLYVTIRHEPYESSGDRVVELPPRSSQDYLVRVPRSGQMRNAIFLAVENDDHELETRLGELPERYGDA